MKVRLKGRHLGFTVVIPASYTLGRLLAFLSVENARSYFVWRNGKRITVNEETALQEGDEILVCFPKKPIAL